MLGGKCVDCGYSTHLAALDFDHIDPSKKKFAVSVGLNCMESIKVMKEAEKCELRCANCHRVKTHPQAHLDAPPTQQELDTIILPSVTTAVPNPV